MSENILVSISCVTFNHAPFIRECLDGFLMQECDFEYEILIHDDASTDGTQEIIKEYMEKYPNIFKPIFQTENQYSKGVRSMFVNFNAKRAKGKYIAMCEGDDYWTDPYKLQKQVDFLEENEDYVLTGHKRIIVDQNNQVINNEKSKQIDIYTQCLLFRNILKEDYLGYKSNEIINGDTFLILYLKNFGKAKILDFVGSAYRISDSGIWSKIQTEKKLVLSEKSLKAMLEFFEKYNYKKAQKSVKEYLIDNKIGFIKSVESVSVIYFLRLIIQCLVQGDLNRLKSVIKLAMR